MVRLEYRAPDRTHSGSISDGDRFIKVSISYGRYNSTHIEIPQG